MKIFIDTSVFIALCIKQEQDHSQVVKQYYNYIKHKAVFFTSHYIIDELLTWFSSHKTKFATEQLLLELEQMIQDEEIQILSIGNSIRTQAKKIFLKFFEHKVSFTDATTYVLYKEFKIDEIFTLDEDFKKMRAKTSLLLP